jgi:ubiquinone biosynthesis protein COQ9
MDEQAKRDALLLSVLPDVPFDGWGRATIDAAARRVGLDAAEMAALFPGGVRDVVGHFSRWADRRMLEALAGRDLSAMKVRERVTIAVRARLDALASHREAVRRALAVLALPQNLALGVRLLYDTVDAVWYAAGDTATDFNFYTKRALLAGVYATTTLCWLEDRSPGMEETHAFLDRRINDVMAIPRYGTKLRERLDRFPNPLRMMRVARNRTSS